VGGGCGEKKERVTPYVGREFKARATTSASRGGTSQSSIYRNRLIFDADRGKVDGAEKKSLDATRHKGQEKGETISNFFKANVNWRYRAEKEGPKVRTTPKDGGAFC